MDMMEGMEYTVQKRDCSLRSDSLRPELTGYVCVLQLNRRMFLVGTFDLDSDMM